MAILGPNGNEISVSGSPDLRELGLSGGRNMVIGGFDNLETNPALAGMAGLDTYRNMGFDPTIQMVLKCIELPVRSTRWPMEPGDDSPLAVEAADFAHWCLWELGGQSFDEVLRQSIQGQHQYGHDLHEICWQAITTGKYAGKWGWSKLAWRAPQSIYRWDVEEIDKPDGGRMRELVAVTQYLPYAEGGNRYVPIPREKLLLFVRDQNGEDYRGTSLLRSCFKPWFIRDKLYSIQAVGLERHYAGTPVGHLPMGYTQAMQTLMKNIVEGIRTHEHAGVVLREDMSLDIIFSKLEGKAMQDAIDFLTHQIPLSALAQFTLLGSGNVGSFALSENQSDLFLMMLNAVCNYTQQTMNLWPGLPQLMAYNYALTEDQMPRLTHGNVGERNFEKLGRTLTGLLQWGAVTPDDGLEDALREGMGLPERDSTVTPEYLKTLVEGINTDELQPRGHDDRYPIPAATNPQAQGVPGAAPAPVPVAASEKAWLNRRLLEQAHARRPWNRAKSVGGRVTGDDRIKVMAAETMLDFLESSKPSGKPELPSIVAAKRRQAYVVMGVDAQPRGHSVSLAEKSKVVPRHQLIAKKHEAALAAFMKSMGSKSRKGHVPLPKGAKLDGSSK